jgi:hypothetical protein
MIDNVRIVHVIVDIFLDLSVEILFKEKKRKKEKKEK